jgi:formylglycine-generating enzyme required for sulfatase activity/uncharacterized caspase-like protein
MGRNWAITIGINRYYNLQGLSCAKRDAETMRDFFLNELGFDQVYHFTEDALPIEQDYGPALSSSPTYATLRRFLRVRFQEPFLRAGDNIWFFFAGHGLNHEERDYLMPLDADPGDVERTAIPINYVTERLRRCGADNVVLLIDACRSASRAGLGIGSETQKGVVTIFSCSPRERSYEIEDPSIGHGAFTYALLRGLRIQGEGNCATVERLYQYLRHQVPELNKRHQKPVQHPYAMVEPASKYHLILLPRAATVRDAEALKLEAFRVEQSGDIELAEQLWIRVLVVSPGDPDAIAGVRRTDRKTPQTPSTSPPPSILRAEPPSTRSASSPPPPSRSSPGTTSPAVSAPKGRVTQQLQSPRSNRPQIQLSRRRVLQIAGLTGGGIGVVLLGRAFQQERDIEPTPGIEDVPSPGLSNLQPETVEGNRFEFNVVTVDSQGKIDAIKRQWVEFRSEDLGNSSSLELVRIPGGEFLMGQMEAEKAEIIRQVGEDKYQLWYANELPRHQVSVSPFWMGTYAVTQAQWKAVAAMPKVEHDLQADPSRFKGENRPVENVSWHDATEFCVRLSKHTGREYRLPSEAEWEYACRGGTTTPFHFGETITTDIANYDGNYAYGGGPKGQYREETTAVGSFSVANSFGLYDMHGNVWEWCLDYWHENYEGAPTDGSAWTTGGDDSYRMLRGGAWYVDARNCRSAIRIRYGPDVRFSSLGFRVVCSTPWEG